MPSAHLALALFLCAGRVIAAPEPLLVGAGAYRQWDRWPEQRIGLRAYLHSTYDRSGGNETSDASHFLYQDRPDFNVTVDLEGAGLLCFARYNHWHGSPWHYEVDGADQVVSETSTADPLHPVEGSTWLPEAAFPRPLAWTWADTRGADLSWVPVGFTKRFRMGYGRTHYGTGYTIFQRWVPGAALAEPVRAWSSADVPDLELVRLAGRTAEELVPAPGSAAARELSLREVESEKPVAPATAATVALVKDRGTVRALSLSVPLAEAAALARVRLRITWDGRAAPSVDAPVPLFFGAGALSNPASREYLVRAFPVTVRFDRERVHLTCAFPMPFFSGAHVELVNDGAAPVTPRCRVAWAPRPETAAAGYFHATYVDHRTPPEGADLVVLDTTRTEGGGDWSGSFVGTSFIFSDRSVLTTLEGDPRFFFDDSRSPQGHGTGTEEWAGGGDYWGGRTMTLPFVGHPVGMPGPEKVWAPTIESAYRFLLGDLMPFGKNARVQLEHGGENRSPEHYQTVAYWYGLPEPTLVRTDALDVADDASARAHAYASPQASAVQEIRSRYEVGPESVERERHTTGASELTLALRPDHAGVLLRRTLDYRWPDQRARVFVADATGGPFQPAGTWYLAGSTTSVHSFPPGELDPPAPVLRDSGRRFRQDEFMLPLALTRGRAAVRVRLEHAPVERAVDPPPERAWSEIRYEAWCFVIPARR